jgi:hypothetical protein
MKQVAAKTIPLFALAVVMIGLLAPHARAESITLEGWASSTVIARATFTLDKDSKLLVVTLTNTSSADVTAPQQVLTGFFWSWDYRGTLSPVSAKLGNGSVVLFDDPPAEGNVGGEWAYASGLTGAPYRASNGISSSGLGLFGAANFNGPDLQEPSTSVAGLQYGITSAGDDPATGNAKVTGSQALIKNSVLFTLAYSGDAPDLSTIIDGSFQYGTSLSEPNVSVPEPSILLLLGIGIGTVSLIGWRCNK